MSEVDLRWHRSAAATLKRDAAAVMLILGDIRDARRELRQSGDLFLDLGFAGGLQLLFIAGTLDAEETNARNRIDTFARAFEARMRIGDAQLSGDRV